MYSVLKTIIFDFDYTLGDSTNGIALTSNDNLYEAEQFIALFKEKADSVMVSNTELYAGVKSVLQKLKAKGYSIAIVTTKFRYRIEQILNKLKVIIVCI